MKTAALTPGDEFELQMLRDKLEREADYSERELERRMRGSSQPSRTSDVARDCRRWIAIINRLLA